LIKTIFPEKLDILLDKYSKELKDFIISGLEECKSGKSSLILIFELAVEDEEFSRMQNITCRLHLLAFLASRQRPISLSKEYFNTFISTLCFDENPFIRKAFYKLLSKLVESASPLVSELNLPSTLITSVSDDSPISSDCICSFWLQLANSRHF
jgi:hypothetical protein